MTTLIHSLKNYAANFGRQYTFASSVIKILISTLTFQHQAWYNVHSFNPFDAVGFRSLSTLLYMQKHLFTAMGSINTQLMTWHNSLQQKE
jgi:hypothetical protein